MFQAVKDNTGVVQKTFVLPQSAPKPNYPTTRAVPRCHKWIGDTNIRGLGNAKKRLGFVEGTATASMDSCTYIVKGSFNVNLKALQIPEREWKIFRQTGKLALPFKFAYSHPVARKQKRIVGIKQLQCSIDKDKNIFFRIRDADSMSTNLRERVVDRIAETPTVQRALTVFQRPVTITATDLLAGQEDICVEHVPFTFTDKVKRFSTNPRGSLMIRDFGRKPKSLPLPGFDPNEKVDLIPTTWGKYTANAIQAYKKAMKKYVPAKLEMATSLGAQKQTNGTNKRFNLLGDNVHPEDDAILAMPRTGENHVMWKSQKTYERRWKMASESAFKKNDKYFEKHLPPIPEPTPPDAVNGRPYPWRKPPRYTQGYVGHRSRYGNRVQTEVEISSTTDNGRDIIESSSEDETGESSESPSTCEQKQEAQPRKKRKESASQTLKKNSLVGRVPTRKPPQKNLRKKKAQTPTQNNIIQPRSLGKAKSSAPSSLILDSTPSFANTEEMNKDSQPHSDSDSNTESSSVKILDPILEQALPDIVIGPLEPLIVQPEDSISTDAKQDKSGLVGLMKDTLLISQTELKNVSPTFEQPELPFDNVQMNSFLSAVDPQNEYKDAPPESSKTEGTSLKEANSLLIPAEGTNLQKTQKDANSPKLSSLEDANALTEVETQELHENTISLVPVFSTQGPFKEVPHTPSSPVTEPGNRDLCDHLGKQAEGTLANQTTDIQRKEEEKTSSVNTLPEAPTTEAAPLPVQEIPLVLIPMSGPSTSNQKLVSDVPSPLAIKASPRQIERKISLQQINSSSDLDAHAQVLLHQDTEDTQFEKSIPEHTKDIDISVNNEFHIQDAESSCISDAPLAVKKRRKSKRTNRKRSRKTPREYSSRNQDFSLPKRDYTSHASSRRPSRYPSSRGRKRHRSPSEGRFHQKYSSKRRRYTSDPDTRARRARNSLKAPILTGDYRARNKHLQNTQTGSRKPSVKEKPMNFQSIANRQNQRSNQREEQRLVNGFAELERQKAAFEAQKQMNDAGSKKLYAREKAEANLRAEKREKLNKERAEAALRALSKPSRSRSARQTKKSYSRQRSKKKTRVSVSRKTRNSRSHSNSHSRHKSLSRHRTSRHSERSRHSRKRNTPSHSISPPRGRSDSYSASRSRERPRRSRRRRHRRSNRHSDSSESRSPVRRPRHRRRKKEGVASHTSVQTVNALKIMLAQAQETELLRQKLGESEAKLIIARSQTPASRSQHSEDPKDWKMHGTFQSAAPTADPYRLDNRKH